MTLPLVLAIEPDPKQASILKNVVRERVGAELVLSDSKEAAIIAIGQGVPDLILVSALLSPRDEAEFSEHLRTLSDAEHLQTLTIPLLAPPAPPVEPERTGLFGIFRRKRMQPAPAGCDPETFADELKGYLDRGLEIRRARAARLARQHVPNTPRVDEAERFGEFVLSRAEQTCEPPAASAASTDDDFEGRRRFSPVDAETPEDSIAPPPVVSASEVILPAPQEAADIEGEPIADIVPLELARLEEHAGPAAAAEAEIAAAPVVTEVDTAEPAPGADEPEPVGIADPAGLPQELAPEIALRIDAPEPIDHKPVAIIETPAIAVVATEAETVTIATPEPVVVDPPAERRRGKRRKTRRTKRARRTAVAKPASEARPSPEASEPFPPPLAAVVDAAPAPLESLSEHPRCAVEEEQPHTLEGEDHEPTTSLAPVEAEPGEASFDAIVVTDAAYEPVVEPLHLEQSVPSPTLDLTASEESVRFEEPTHDAPIETVEEAVVSDAPVGPSEAAPGDGAIASTSTIGPMPDMEIWQPLRVWSDEWPPFEAHVSFGPADPWTHPAIKAAQPYRQPPSVEDNDQDLEQVVELSPAVSPPPPLPEDPGPMAVTAQWIANALDALRLDIQLLRAEQPPMWMPPPTGAAPDAARSTGSDIQRTPSTPPDEERSRLDASSETRVQRRKPPRPVQDEWGVYDPSQAGFEALFATIEAEESAAAEEVGQPAAGDLLLAGPGPPDSLGGATTAPESNAVDARRSQRLAPLAMWARSHTATPDADASAVEPDEVRAFFERLTLPPSVAAVTYRTGCRIRRVRVKRPKRARRSGEPVIILSRKLLRHLTAREPETRGVQVRGS